MIELDVPSAAEADYFLALVRNLLEGVAGSILEETFTQWSAPDTILRIPRLEIVLDPIVGAVFEQSFCEALEKKLAQWSLPGNRTPAQVIPSLDASIETLRFFIQTGLLPWWTRRRASSMNALFQQLIREQPIPMRTLGFQLGRVPVFRNRILLQFTDDTLTRLFGILSAEPSSFFREYVRTLSTIQRKERIVQEEDTRFKRVLHELIYIYLIDHKATSIDQVAFLQAQLLRLGRRYGIAYPCLLGRIQEALKKIAGTERNSNAGIYGVIDALWNREYQPVQKLNRGAVQMHQELDQLGHFLEKGFFQYAAEGVQYASRHLFFMRLMEVVPEPTLRLIREKGRQQTVRERLAGGFSETVVQKMFALLAPFKSEVLYEVFELLEYTEKKHRPVNQEHQRFRLSIRELAIKILIEAPTGQLTLQQFLRSHLKALSLRHGVGYHQLLTLLQEDISEIPWIAEGVFSEVLGVLIQEEMGIHSRISAPPSGKLPLHTISIEELEIQLNKPGRIQGLSLTELNWVWQQLVEFRWTKWGQMADALLHSRPRRISPEKLQRAFLWAISQQPAGRSNPFSLVADLIIGFLKSESPVFWMGRLEKAVRKTGGKQAQSILSNLENQLASKSTPFGLNHDYALTQLLEYLGKEKLYNQLQAAADVPPEAVWSQLIASYPDWLWQQLLGSFHRNAYLDMLAESMPRNQWDTFLLHRLQDEFKLFIQVEKELKGLQVLHGYARMQRSVFSDYLFRVALPYLLQADVQGFRLQDFLFSFFDGLERGGKLNRSAIPVMANQLNVQVIKKELIELLGWWLVKKNRNPDFRSQNSQFFTDILFFYIRYGGMPFWAKDRSISEKELASILLGIIRRKDSIFIEILLPILSEKRALDRLFDLLDTEGLGLLFDILQRMGKSRQPELFFRQGKAWLEILFPGSATVWQQQELLRLFFLIGSRKRSEVHRMVVLGQMLITKAGVAAVIPLLDGEFTWLAQLLRNRWQPTVFGQEDQLRLFRYFLEVEDTAFWEHNDRVEWQKIWVRLLVKSPEQVLAQLEGMAYVKRLNRRFVQLFSVEHLLLLFQVAARVRKVDTPMFLDFQRTFLHWAQQAVTPREFEHIIGRFLAFFVCRSELRLEDIGGMLENLSKYSATIRAFLKRFFQKRHIPPAEPRQWMYQPLVNSPIRSEQNVAPGAWDALVHFIRYGSQPIWRAPFSERDLGWLFVEELKGRSMRMRYQVHAWSASGRLRARMLALAEGSQHELVQALIHPELPAYLSDFNALLEAVPGDAVWEGMGIKGRLDLTDKILQIWSGSPVILSTPTLVIHRLVVEVGNALGITTAVLLENIRQKSGFEWKDSKVGRTVPGNRKQELFEELEEVEKETTLIPLRPMPGEHKAEPVAVPAGTVWQVYNAGMVLLWPFLGRFFRKLGLVEGNDFRDESARMRAIQLLEYLVTGKTEFEEHALFLNKILCGVDESFIVGRYLELSEEEAILSESLLQGAIFNWEKMRGTRTATFRETFLQREGRLVYLENRWELKVERKAYDLLLDTLTWSIAMIKTAWMKDRLVVLWN